MLLNDKAIRDLCISTGGRYLWEGIKLDLINPMIDPFTEGVSGDGVVSYGLTSAGYDLRLAPEILVYKNSWCEPVDPRCFGDEEYRKRLFDVIFLEDDVDKFILPPHSSVLARSYEYLHIPRFLKGRVTGKSTYARCSVLVNCTPLEPKWKGHLTIEIGNYSPCPVVLRVMQGIAQLEIEVLTEEPEIDYEQKKGVYQGQIGVTPARVK